MIIWGYKGYQKELGHTQSAIQCGNCQQTAPWDIIETGRKFSLYWIPLIPYGKNITSYAQFANAVKKSKNKILMNI